MTPLSDFLRAWFPLASLLFNAILLWVAWSMRQLAKEEVDRIVAAAVARLDLKDQQIERDLAEHESRLTRQEESMKSLPKREDLDALNREISQVGKSVAAQNAEIIAMVRTAEATQRSVDRLYNYMLEHNR